VAALALGQLGAVHQADVRAEGGQLGDERRAPHHVDGSHAARPREPDDEAPDRGVGHVLHQPVAGLQIDQVGQQQQRGGRVDAEHRGLEAIEVRGHRDHVVGGHPPPLGPVLPL